MGTFMSIFSVFQQQSWFYPFEAWANINTDPLTNSLGDSYKLPAD